MAITLRVDRMICPDCVEIVKRFNRYHHNVNYRIFERNKLIRKEGIEVKDRINDYGMVLIRRDQNQLVKSE